MDAETLQIIESLAKFVAEGGPEVEEIAVERNQENPAFRSFIISVLILCYSETFKSNF